MDQGVQRVLEGHDVCACIEREYADRTVDLQARSRLVKFTGPVTYACTNAEGETSEVIARSTKAPT